MADFEIALSHFCRKQLFIVSVISRERYARQLNPT
jgi:hypothetical protein